MGRVISCVCKFVCLLGLSNENGLSYQHQSGLRYGLDVNGMHVDITAAWFLVMSSFVVRCVSMIVMA